MSPIRFCSRVPPVTATRPQQTENSPSGGIPPPIFGNSTMNTPAIPASRPADWTGRSLSLNRKMARTEASRGCIETISAEMPAERPTEMAKNTLPR